MATSELWKGLPMIGNDDLMECAGCGYRGSESKFTDGCPKCLCLQFFPVEGDE